MTLVEFNRLSQIFWAYRMCSPIVVPLYLYLGFTTPYCLRCVSLIIIMMFQNSPVGNVKQPRGSTVLQTKFKSKKGFNSTHKAFDEIFYNDLSQIHRTRLSSSPSPSPSPPTHPPPPPKKKIKKINTYIVV